MKTFSTFFLALMLGLCSTQSAWAQYTDVPWTVSSNRFTMSDDNSNFTFRTSSGYNAQSDHFVVFWSSGFGSKTGSDITLTYNGATANVTQMLAKAEECYTKYLELGFIFPDTWNHKIIILLFQNSGISDMSNEGNYPYVRLAPANVNTSVSDPYWTFCHEIAHTFQFLGYFKNGGNAGFQYGDYYGFVSYYECCGNWQSAQLHPHLYFPQADSYESQFYFKTRNLGWIHQWHCYQSFIMNDYFTEKCGQTTIGDIWTVNTNTAHADPIEKYMYNTGATAEEVYRQFFFGAMRAVTWDLDRWQAYLTAEGKTEQNYMYHTPGTKACKNDATPTPATYDENCWQTQSYYQYVTTNSAQATHQVAYSSAPQSTGYNIIQLNVPTSSTNRTVTTTFTALAPGANLASGDQKEYWQGAQWASNSSQTTYNKSQTSECNSTYNTYRQWRGFRLGYVAYNSSTRKRYYNYTDQVYCTGTSEASVNVQFDVPSDADQLYLVVSPALSNYLRMGSVDPYNIETDAQYLSTQQSFDQWPYRVRFYNTNIYGLSNPSQTFSGTATQGTTYTSATLPDLESGGGEEPDPDPIGEVEHTTITRSINMPAAQNEENRQTVALTSAELATIASYLGVSAANFQNLDNWEEWTASGPSNGKLMFYAVNPDGETLEASGTTAEEPGHWFDGNGNVTSMWIGGEFNEEVRLFSIYDRENASFSVGQMPEALSVGEQKTIRQAIVYNNNGTLKAVYFTFNVTMTATQYTLNFVGRTTAQGAGFSVVAGSGAVKNSDTTFTMNSSGLVVERDAEDYWSPILSDYITINDVTGYNKVVSISGTTITVTYAEMPATSTYTVSYSGRTTAQGAGFNVVAGSGAVKNSNTSVSLPAGVTTANILDYITPNTVSAYNVAVTVSGTTVAVTYTAQTTTTTTETRYIYQLTTTLTAGEEYLIVNSNSAGSRYALGHDGTTIARDAVTVKAAATGISTAAYIEATDVDATSVWTVATGYTFKNGDYYVGITTSGTRSLRISTTSTNWTWSSNNNRLSANNYYLRYNNNTFSVSTTRSSVYLYKKTEVTVTTGSDTNVGTINVPVEMINGTDLRVNWDSSSSYTQMMLGAFGLSSLSDFYNSYQHYYDGDPTAHPTGTYMFYGVNADNSIYGFAYTANQGFFYDAAGDVVASGTSYVEMEYIDVTDPEYPEVSDRLQWHVGLPGGDLAVGDTRTLRTAMRYYDATNSAWKTFYINFVVTSVAPPVIEDDAAMTLTFNVIAPDGDYEPIYQELSAAQIASINSFFGVADFTSSYILDYGMQNTAGTLMFFAQNPDGSKSASTAYHPGHWFLPDGTASAWDGGETAKVYSQFYIDGGEDHSVPTFELGQAGVTSGDGYTVKEGLRYYDGTSYKTVYFVFNISLGETFAALTLDENATTYDVTRGSYLVTLNRTLKAGGTWNSFTVPFDITASKLSSLGITSVKELTSMSEEGQSVTLNFTDASEIHAGVPYIVQVDAEKTSLNFTDAPVVVHPANSLQTVSVEGATASATMVGNYAKMYLPDDIYYIQSNTFRHTTYTGSTQTPMKGFRAYFTVDFGSEVKAVSAHFDENGVVTAIGKLPDLSGEGDSQQPVYDLQGRRVAHPAKGIYIVNGKKVLFK